MIEGHPPHGAGRSTFELVDLDRVLEGLALTPSTVFLDLGCGRGNYTVAVARTIGPGGRIYGIDAWQEGLNDLTSRAACTGVNNIETIQANLNEHIPVEDSTVDVCFMATVLHDLLRESSPKVVMEEIFRVLRPDGRFCVVEFKKVEEGPGPPLSMRLAPEETERVIAQYGFVKDRVVDIGPFHYLLVAFPDAKHLPQP